MLSSGGNAGSPEDQHGKHGEKQTPGEKAHFAFLPNVPFFRIASCILVLQVGRGFTLLHLETSRQDLLTIIFKLLIASDILVTYIICVV